MARSKLMGLVFESWNDIDRVLGGLDHREATHVLDGGSSFAWTLAHVTQQVDAWINVRFLNRAPHSFIGQQRFRIGGTGVVEDWRAVLQGVNEVRDTARDYLNSKGEDELDLKVPYDGSILSLRQTGLSLHYALLRICAHRYFHIGEIATKRDCLGQVVGDYPGLLESCI